MRGVDVGTKREVYSLIRGEADKGRMFVWYTTEIDELINILPDKAPIAETFPEFAQSRASMQSEPQTRALHAAD